MFGDIIDEMANILMSARQGCSRLVLHVGNDACSHQAAYYYAYLRVLDIE
jgi:hypothetical protein